MARRVFIADPPPNLDSADRALIAEAKIGGRLTRDVRRRVETRAGELLAADRFDEAFELLMLAYKEIES